MIDQALKEKRHQHGSVLLGHEHIGGFEVFIVLTPVIGGHLHAQEQQFGMGLLAKLGHALKVRLCHFQVQSSQGIVGAKFQHHDLGMMRGQERRQPGQSARGGVATDA